MANPFTSKTAGASALDFLAPDVAQDQRRLDRRQQLADLLLAQAVQPTDTGTQSVGGWAIPNNAVKPFEKLGMALIANRSQSRVDEQRADLAKRYAEALSSKTGGTPGTDDPMQAAALAALGVPEAIIAESVLGPKTRPVTVNRGNQTEVVMVPERGSGPLTPSYTAPVAPTPDAVMRDQTTRRGQDLTQSTTLRGQDITLRGQDITQGTAIRGQDMTAETARLLASPDVKAAQAAATAGAQAGVEATTKRDADQRRFNDSFRTYETAITGLVEGLDSAATGPLVGRLPAFSTGAQVAEGAIAAMAPVLKDLFRTAGEGVFTDKDQELLLEMIPKRTDTPMARTKKLQNIDAIVRSKLRQGAPEPLFNESAMPSGGDVDPLGLR